MSPESSTRARNGGQPWFRSNMRVVIGAGAIAVGAMFVAGAISFSSPVLGVIGVAISAMGLVPVDTLLSRLSESHGVQSLTAGAAFLFLGVAGVGSAFATESAFLAALAVAVGGLGLLILGKQLIIAGRRRPFVWVIAGLTLAAAGVGMASLLDLHWIAGILLVGVGLSCFRIGIRPLCETKKYSRGCISAGFVAGLTGVILVLVGVFGTMLISAALGLFLLAFGLIPLSIGLRHRRVPLMTPRWAIATGLAVGVAGALFYPGGGPWSVRLGILGILALVGASFSVRLEGFVAVVLIGFLFAWVLADRIDVAPLDPNPYAAGRILALGDSYTSGEGSTRFFEGTNVIGENENQCRRSSTAYPYLVAQRLGMGLDFYACSGATALQVFKEPQMGEESPDDVPGELPQLANIKDTSQIRVVLVSIGGNDAGFGDIGKACVVPGSCPAFRELWLVRAGRSGGAIRDAFEAIRNAVGSSTPVVAVPYPLLVTEGGCDWSVLDGSEHDFLFEMVTVLDDRVRRSAEQAGINFFEPGLFAFEGKKICNGRGPDDTVMNLVNAHPMQGSFLDRINPVNWVHGTFHPKPSGHVAIADVLTPWLEKLLSDIDAGIRPANPVPNPDAPFFIRKVGGEETVLKDPRELPRTMPCPVEDVSAFATLLPLRDATSAFKLNAVPGEPICYSRPDGTWTDDEVGVVTRAGEEATITPQLPSDGWTQTFVYKDAVEKTWQVRILEFCNQKPYCPNDISPWIKDQLLAAARTSVLPALLVFAGGWLLGLGLTLEDLALRGGRSIQGRVKSWVPHGGRG
jgi:lysophospholipase L1-like esterase